ncbi:SH3 domain-containing protein [Novosphingobium guangzhouense]|nr:SH3 domain-containing protein [Novosphingobium guangzhouense]
MPAQTMLAMTGPSVSADPGHLPVRGDLAHIKLAGRYFVPHYAVPMPHTLKDGAVLRVFGRDDADAIIDLPAGETFNVLDIAGAWSWGQLGEDGAVGYVALSDLEAA